MNHMDLDNRPALQVSANKPLQFADRYRAPGSAGPSYDPPRRNWWLLRLIVVGALVIGARVWLWYWMHPPATTVEEFHAGLQEKLAQSGSGLVVSDCVYAGWSPKVYTSYLEANGVYLNIVNTHSPGRELGYYHYIISFEGRDDVQVVLYLVRENDDTVLSFKVCLPEDTAIDLAAHEEAMLLGRCLLELSNPSIFSKWSFLARRAERTREISARYDYRPQRTVRVVWRDHPLYVEFMEGTMIAIAYWC